ncbi:MAG: hypothetical protein RXO25_03315, partial [Caldivirga sp.]
MAKAGGGRKGTAKPTKARFTISESEFAELRFTQWFGLLASLAAVFAAGLYIRLYPAYLWGSYINE